jgi:hypothetical protein
VWLYMYVVAYMRVCISNSYVWFSMAVRVVIVLFA